MHKNASFTESVVVPYNSTITCIKKITKNEKIFSDIKENILHQLGAIDDVENLLCEYGNLFSTHWQKNEVLFYNIKGNVLQL